MRPAPGPGRLAPVWEVELLAVPARGSAPAEMGGPPEAAVAKRRSVVRAAAKAVQPGLWLGAAMRQAEAERFWLHP
jgi:hypothetical protein